MKDNIIVKKECDICINNIQDCIIYVKEFRYLTVNTVKEWVKHEYNVVTYHEEITSYNDYVVVSRGDEKKNIYGNAVVIIYEDFFGSIVQCMTAELTYNYDYYYLNNALQESKRDYIDTIITGSSYGLHGIDGEQLVSATNLSLPSQDLYYSIKGIEAVCRENKNIKNVVICCSYYYLYSDLSMSKAESELSRISKVYYPLFSDLHNALYLPLKKSFLIRSRIVDVQELMELYSISEYNKFYFNENRQMSNFAVKEWDDVSKSWQQLSEGERMEAGAKRARKHNEANKYPNTYKENVLLIDRLSKYCEEKNINLVVMVTPVSKYYREVSLKKYKEDFYQALNKAGGGNTCYR